MNTVYVLWNNANVDSPFLVGVFVSHIDALDGWQRYCKSRQWHRDMGTHEDPTPKDYSIDEHVLGNVQTTPTEGDDGCFG